MPPTQRQPLAGAGALGDQPRRGAQATTAKREEKKQQSTCGWQQVPPTQRRYGTWLDGCLGRKKADPPPVPVPRRTNQEGGHKQQQPKKKNNNNQPAGVVAGATNTTPVWRRVGLSSRPRIEISSNPRQRRRLRGSAEKKKTRKTKTTINLWVQWLRQHGTGQVPSHFR